MFDFSKMTSFSIPEGNVALISVNGSTVWESETWDVKWICTGSLPSTSVWERIASPGTLKYIDTYGQAVRMLCTNGTSNDQGVALRLKDYTSRFGQQCVFETEIYIESVQTDSGGVRIILGAGNASGTALAKGLKITINQNSTDGNVWMHVLQTTDVIGTQKKTALVTLNEWHKIRLSIDTINDSNKVYLDGKLVATLTNSQLSTMDTSNTWLNVKNGTCYVRSLKYRKDA